MRNAERQAVFEACAAALVGRNPAHLTHSERDLLRLRSAGWRVADVMRIWHVTRRRVKTIERNLLRKLRQWQAGCSVFLAAVLDEERGL